MEQMSSRVIRVDGKSLTIPELIDVVRGGSSVKLLPEARKRARLSHQLATWAAKQRTLYGRNTGVGGNKSVSVTPDTSTGHGLRLLRSHSAGAGPAVKPELLRAMLVVRLNQLAAGGSGVNPALLDILVDAINKGVIPPVTKYGAIGTGDLTALATTALCIMGERPWRQGSLPKYHLDDQDALAFMSSNAATLAEAALACHDLRVLQRASLAVAALPFLALDGSSEALAAEVHQARPNVGQQQVAAELRKLLGPDLRRLARQVQDSFCLRAFPQVHGPAMEAAERLEEILLLEMNAASENPLIDPATGKAFHNGNFHLANAGLALDNIRAATYQTAALSVARLSQLMEPAATGLRPFLAGGPTASSGLLITEYVAHSALAELHLLTTPASIGEAVLSRGAEEHASFATQSAWHTTASVSPYETILACELLAAVRALHQRNIVPKGSLKRQYEMALAALDPDESDRPLDADIATAVATLREF